MRDKCALQLLMGGGGLVQCLLPIFGSFWIFLVLFVFFCSFFFFFFWWYVQWNGAQPPAPSLLQQPVLPTLLLDLFGSFRFLFCFCCSFWFFFWWYVHCAVKRCPASCSLPLTAACAPDTLIGSFWFFSFFVLFLLFFLVLFLVVCALCSETVPSLSLAAAAGCAPDALMELCTQLKLNYFTSLHCTPTSVFCNAMCCTGLQLPPVCNAGTLMWWSTRECGSECKWWAGPWSPPTTPAPWSTVVAASWSSSWSHGSPSTGHWSQNWQSCICAECACREKQFAKKKLIPFHFHNKRGRLSTWFSNHLNKVWSQKQRIHARGHFSCQRKDRIQGGNLFHKTPLSPSCHKCDFCFILCSVIWLLCGACSELRRVYPSGACNCHSAWQVPEKAPPVSASLCVISTTLLYPHHDSIPLRSYCRSRSSYRGIKLVRRLL